VIFIRPVGWDGKHERLVGSWRVEREASQGHRSIPLPGWYGERRKDLQGLLDRLEE
jgi:hypothetical protein